MINKDTVSCRFTETLGSILPTQTVPWLLSEKPNDYGSDYKLFQEIITFLKDHVELPKEDDYIILAAWTMAANRFQEFESFPYICAIGPPGSGKTRLLKTLWQLSYRGLFGVGMTASAMFRAIDKDNVSLFLDQCELLSNTRERPDFLALVDNGYQEGGKKFLTNLEKGTYEAYSVYSPKAFSSTKSLEGTLESRSIRFNMQSKTRNISIRIDKTRATILRSKLLLYKFRHSEDTEATEDTEAKLMSITKNGRLIELFLPLYVIVTSSSFPSGPSSPSVKIIDYLKNLNRSRIANEQVSVDAQMIRAITDCEDQVQSGKLKCSVIVEKFNDGKNDWECWKTKTVAKKVRDLGFEACRMNDGSSGIYWNEPLLKGHQRRFLIDEKTEAETVRIEVGLPVEIEVQGELIQ